MELKIEVQGIDKIVTALGRFPRQIQKNMAAAGAEAAKRVILKEQGLQKYPPATAANRPPTPYYIRGQGTMYKSGLRATSERYGTQFYVEASGYDTIIGNRASYAIYVGGERQPEHMASKGWRKLYDVAQEKITDITAVYQAWVDRTIKQLGL